MNKIFLIGRITKTPEIRSTSTSKRVASFSLAISEGKDQNGQSISQFFNCTAWDKKADLIERYTTKGSKIAIVGKLQNRSWTKPDGSKGYSTDILVAEIELLDSKKDREDLGEKEAASDESFDIDDLNVEVPF